MIRYYMSVRVAYFKVKAPADAEQESRLDTIESALENKIEASDLPDLSGYASMSDVADATSGLASTSYVGSQLLSYATSSAVSSSIASAVSGLASTSYVGSQLSSYATSSAVSSAISSATSGLVSSAGLATALGNYTNTSDMNDLLDAKLDVSVHNTRVSNENDFYLAISESMFISEDADHPEVEFPFESKGLLNA
jgi:hypothetical protein